MTISILASHTSTMVKGMSIRFMGLHLLSYAISSVEGYDATTASQSTNSWFNKLFNTIG